MPHRGLLLLRLLHLVEDLVLDARVFENTLQVSESVFNQSSVVDLEELLVEFLSVLHDLALLVDRNQVIKPL